MCIPQRWAIRPDMPDSQKFYSADPMNPKKLGPEKNRLAEIDGLDVTRGLRDRNRGKRAHQDGAGLGDHEDDADHEGWGEEHQAAPPKRQWNPGPGSGA